MKYQYKEFPVIDFAIVMKFETCPKELERILIRHEYSFEKINTQNRNGDIPCGVKLDWLTPKEMGDSILVFEYATDDSRYIKTLWTSTDSILVYCREITD